MSHLPAHYHRGVPGIPSADLSNVQDPATRNVLRALVDGWHVRNAAAGNGDARFITAAEAKATQQQIGTLQQGLQAAQKVLETPPQVNQSDIARIINDLQAQVIESQLFKELGDRITLIETVNVAQGNTITHETQDRVNSDNALYSTINTQVTRIDGNISGLQTQQTTTANNLAALSSTVTTVQAQSNNNTAAIQTEATARANADGLINAKYSVKVDVNGYVSGFGLISTANNATPTSSFIIRADKFAIASPSGPGIAPVVPFIVTTTPQTLPDGTVLPAGVYMDTAVVKRLDGAYINAGLLTAGKIYSGSQYIDIVSKQVIPAVAMATVFTPFFQPANDQPNPYVRSFSYQARLYGSGWHTHYMATSKNRVRHMAANEQLVFIVSVNATVDHYMSIWYRIRSDNPENLSDPVNVNTTWQPSPGGEFCVEPQSGYGTANLTVQIPLYLADSQWVEFTVTALGKPSGSWVMWNTSYPNITDFTMTIQAVNL